MIEEIIIYICDKVHKKNELIQLYMQIRLSFCIFLRVLNVSKTFIHTFYESKIDSCNLSFNLNRIK